MALKEYKPGTAIAVVELLTQKSRAASLSWERIANEKTR
jgi:hypothetical protein